MRADRYFSADLVGEHDGDTGHGHECAEQALRSESFLALRDRQPERNEWSQCDEHHGGPGGGVPEGRVDEGVARREGERSVHDGPDEAWSPREWSSGREDERGHNQAGSEEPSRRSQNGASSVTIWRTAIALTAPNRTTPTNASTVIRSGRTS
jgi:hypothetical protein